MANTIKIKRGSGSDPAASDMVLGEPVLRTDTAELFFKKDDGSVAKVSGGGGGPDFKYLELRNAANNGAASYPANDFTLVTSGTTNAITPAAANTLLVSVNGVIQKPNAGTSTSGITGFIVDGSRFKTATNLTQAPDFILYQESGGIGEPSDNTVSEEKLKVSNSPVNGYFLSAQSGNTGGLTWAAPIATSCTGNSATATALATARTINGTSFDGTANITVTAAAGTLTGNTLNSSVTASSLTSLGDLAGLTVDGDMSLTGANYNVLWDKSDNALEFADNAKARFGTGNDLQIYHNGSHSYIDDAGTGNLYIRSSQLVLQNAAGDEDLAILTSNGAVKLYFDDSKKFETTSGGVAVTGVIEATGNIKLGDDRFVYFGAGVSTDLYIGHQPSDSRHLFRSGDGATKMVFQGGSETMMVLQPQGAVELYHDNSKTFETTASGVSITGGFVTTGNSTVNDNGKISFGTGNDLQIYHSGTFNRNYIQATGTNHDLTIAGDEVAITNSVISETLAKFIADGAVELYHNNVNRLATSTTGIRVESRIAGMSDDNTYVNIGTGSNDQFQFYTGGVDRLFLTGGPSDSGTVQIRGDNNFLQIGAGQDLDLHHNGTNSYIRNKTGDLHIRPLVAEEGIILKPNAAVELYFDNSKKFETISGGAKITGSLGINTTPSGYYSNDLVLAAGNGGGMTIAASSTSDTNFINFADAANSGGYLMGGILYQHSTNVLAFRANDAERMRIDSSGAVRIAHTSFTADTGADDLIVGSGNSGANRGITILNHTGQDGRLCFGQSGDPDAGMIKYSHGSDVMQFFVESDEKVRIGSNGDIDIDEAIGQTHSARVAIQHSGINPAAALLLSAHSSFQGSTLVSAASRNTTNGSYIHFKCSINGVADKFRVLDNGNCANTNNSFSSLSDVNLKENIVDAGSQWNDIKNIRVRKFNFKEGVDPEKPTLLGVIAQEAELVCPNLIETDVQLQAGEEKEYKSFKYSVLYMKAIKCLQEAMAKIEVLEAKVTTLEAK